MFARTGFVVALLCSCGFAACRGDTDPADPTTAARPTYRFTARITHSDVPPFKVGEVIEGTFSYALLAERERRQPSLRHEHGFYNSPHNRIFCRLGKARFVGAGVQVGVLSSHELEMFVIGAADMTLPDGWSMEHTREAYAFSINMSRKRPKDAIRRVALPERLALSVFSTRLLNIQFANGVRFPSGEVSRAALVLAAVETLEEKSP
jgi:hypothetical protein